MNRLVLSKHILLSFLFFISLCSCSKQRITNEETDYGSLTISNINNLRIGDSKEIEIVFSKSNYKSEILYTFEGNDIAISGGKVQAVNANKTVVVTAKAKHHSTSFTVKTVTQNDLGLSIKDVNAWIGYPATEFFPKFSNGSGAKNITYEYDQTKIQVDLSKNTIKALQEGKYKVIATIENSSVEFYVNCYTVDKTSGKFNTSPYNDYATQLNQKWTTDESGSATTLFIGDSFFDNRNFWQNFYTTYNGRDVQCFGISSTTSYDWETYLDSWLGNLKPKNIVMHVGTNNVYDDNDSAEQAILSLQRMFILMHSKMPNSNIYYFGISQRTYDVGKIEMVSAINTEMQNWCNDRSWIKYLNTPIKLTSNMLKDNIHPKPEYYYVFTDELQSSNIFMENRTVNDKIKDISRDKTQTIGNFPSNIVYKGETLSRNFVLSGKIDVTGLNNNAHLEFNFSGSNNRMLLWNNESNDKIKVGYAFNGTYNNAAPQNAIYNFIPNQTLTLGFKLVVTDNDGYLYINDKLVLVFVKIVGSVNPLILSSENMSCKFYNMAAVTKNTDKHDYDTAIIAVQEAINNYSARPVGAVRP